MGGTCTLVILLCTNRMYLPVVELHSTVHNTVHSRSSDYFKVVHKDVSDVMKGLIKCHDKHRSHL